jgi:uncharacterized membrane protein YjgN (DUF898 family)
MNIETILTATFVPVCVTLIFALLGKTNISEFDEMSHEQFIVSLPKTFFVIGLISDLFFAVAIIGLPFISKENPHVGFCIIFGLFLWLGTFLILKAWRFRVVVNGEDITVYSIIRVPYTFTFSDIISVRRQVKRNRIKSERIIVKTKSGRKLILESSEISYEKFQMKIKSKVCPELLIGF